jgi:hypothetical protein
VLGAVALALLVGLPNLVLLALTLRRDARAPAAAVAVGLGLVLWILVELAFLRELSFLHPLYAGVGLLMVLAGLSWQARSR